MLSETSGEMETIAREDGMLRGLTEDEKALYRSGDEKSRRSIETGQQIVLTPEESAVLNKVLGIGQEKA